VLGLAIKKNLKVVKIILTDTATNLAKERDAARATKNWSESDRLRKELEALGYTVEDTKDGTKISKK
jgi:cysteinyl-tRNA synthetase